MQNTFTNATYQFGWVTDADAKTQIQVIKRTAKRITFTIQGETRTKGIKVDDDGCEYFYPCGVYSMAPTCHVADKVA